MRFHSSLLAFILFMVMTSMWLSSPLLFDQLSGSSSPEQLATDQPTSVVVSQDNDASNSNKLALQESLQFFYDISQEEWQKLKVRTTKERLYEFPCPNEERIGGTGDGGKWICDIRRLKRVHEDRVAKGEPGCLVYSFGSAGLFQFELAILEFAPFCEIHTFDPTDYSQQSNQETGGRVHYHTYGLKASYETPPAWKNTGKRKRGNQFSNPTGIFKSLPEITQELNHQGRVVDIFKIDCEGCEYLTYKDWFTVDMRQILVETHHTGIHPYAPNLFQALHEHQFVVYHDEYNEESKPTVCVEFSLLRMAPSFFEGGSPYNATHYLKSVVDKIKT